MKTHSQFSNRRGVADTWLLVGLLCVSTIFAGRAAWKTFGRPESNAAADQAHTDQATLGDYKPTIAFQPIETIRVGQRMVGTNPLRDEVDHTLSEPDEQTWRLLTLVMTKSDGTRLDITLLRPLAWIEAHGAKVGTTIDLDLVELGASGAAKVLAIDASPPIEPPPGQVVTGIFHHEASQQILNIRVEGQTEPIGVTNNHLFWSDDRQDFVPAGELRLGETLLTLGGKVQVASIKLRGPPEPVYNLEVHGEHVYRVGVLGTLVHNGCAAPSGFSNPQFGGKVHAKFLDALTEQTGTNLDDWIISPRGVDATYVGDPSRYPGFGYAELKPRSIAGLNRFEEQIGRWNPPRGQTSLWFYNESGIIGSTGTLW